MTPDLTNLVDEIDHMIRQHKWFDFHVLNYNGTKLTIAGGIDLTYYHTLEVIFEDVFFVSGFFNGWHSDTNSAVFVILDNGVELNKHLEIEQVYQLFILRPKITKTTLLLLLKRFLFR